MGTKSRLPGTSAGEAAGSGLGTKSRLPGTSAGQAARYRTKWCRYEMRSNTIQASQIRQHATTEVHRIAVEAYINPDKPAEALLQRVSAGDAALLSGAVPQPEDWLRAWRVARTPQSFATAEKTAKPNGASAAPPGPG